MKRAEIHQDIILDYGRTSRKIFPKMQRNKYFSVGYNKTYGHIVSCEDNGDPIFDGMVKVKGLLSKLESEKQETKDSKVHNFIMRSYDNWNDFENNPRKYDNVPPEPILHVSTNIA